MNYLNLYERLKTSKFRSSFHLKENDFEYIDKKGIDVIRQHAMDFVKLRIAPAEPENDGKQTPFRGHPVFIAQHATATCCRSCIEKWHKISKHKELADFEIDYIVDVIMGFIQQEIENKNAKMQ